MQFQFYCTADNMIAMNCENGGGVLLWSVAVELKTKSVESFIGVGCSTGLPTPSWKAYKAITPLHKVSYHLLLL